MIAEYYGADCFFLHLNKAARPAPAVPNTTAKIAIDVKTPSRIATESYSRPPPCKYNNKRRHYFPRNFNSDVVTVQSRRCNQYTVRRDSIGVSSLLTLPHCDSHLMDLALRLAGVCSRIHRVLLVPTGNDLESQNKWLQRMHQNKSCRSTRVYLAMKFPINSNKSRFPVAILMPQLQKL